MTLKKIKLLKNVIYALAIIMFIALTALLLLRLKVEPVRQTADNIEASQITKLQNRISRIEQALQTHIQKASPINAQDIALLNDRFNTLEKTNLEILDSKANIAALMGLIERIDFLESQIKTLNAGTSASALVLTAAALVENAAKKRMPFMYEASVLSELSRGTPMEKSAQIIAGISVKGLPAKEDLIHRFITLYETTLPQATPTESKKIVTASQDWKQKLYNKLKSLIVIEKISSDDAFDFNEIPLTDDVYRSVLDGDFETAILKMSVNPKYQTEAFQIWVEDAQSEKMFDKQMAKIKALTLSAMKLETFE